MKTELVVKDNALINASYNLDLVFAFSQIHENMNQKLPRRIDRKRDSIEFERTK